MPLGTTLLQSPGWNEGEARHGTLGKHGQKDKSSVGAALSARAFTLSLGCAAPLGLINILTIITQGLPPGLGGSIALSGLIYVFINYLLILMCLPCVL